MRWVLLVVAAAALTSLPTAPARAQQEVAGATHPAAGVERGDAYRPMTVGYPAQGGGQPDRRAGGGARHDLHRAVAAGR
jgi:hypothetical protein